MSVKVRSLVAGYFPPAGSAFGDAARHAVARYYVPESQREWASAWSTTKQSDFIDSIMRNFPIPNIICNRDPDGRLALYEGRHRTETLWRFTNGHLKWNGKTYSELSDIERHQFNEQTLLLLVIQDATLDQLSEVFERLNNGAPLSDSDKFWNRRHTPLVQLTREVVLTHAGLRRVLGEIDMNTRGHLANYVGLTAGIVLDSNCFTTSYMRLFPHLELDGKSYEDCKAILESTLNVLVSFYEEANTRFPTTKRRELSKYRKIGFINAYFLTDLMCGQLEEALVNENACKEKWLTLIGHLRNPQTAKAAAGSLATKGAQNLTLTKITTVIAQVEAYLQGDFQGEGSVEDSDEEDLLAPAL
jgi:hypothetical protein